MTPAELNQFYATLKLVIKKASSIQADSIDKYMYHTDFKKRCSKNARDILIMAESAMTLINEQRKAKNIVIDEPIDNERPFPV